MQSKRKDSRRQTDPKKVEATRKIRDALMKARSEGTVKTFTAKVSL